MTEEEFKTGVADQNQEAVQSPAPETTIVDGSAPNEPSDAQAGISTEPAPAASTDAVDSGVANAAVTDAAEGFTLNQDAPERNEAPDVVTSGTEQQGVPGGYASTTAPTAEVSPSINGTKPILQEELNVAAKTTEA